MKIAALILVLLGFTGCTSIHAACEERKAASEGLCAPAEVGAHYSPVVDPSLRF